MTRAKEDITIHRGEDYILFEALPKTGDKVAYNMKLKLTHAMVIFAPVLHSVVDPEKYFVDNVEQAIDEAIKRLKEFKKDLKK